MNPTLALWLVEYSLCEKFSTKPKGLFHNLNKTIFFMEITHQTSRLQQAELNKAKNKMKSGGRY